MKPHDSHQDSGDLEIAVAMLRLHRAGHQQVADACLAALQTQQGRRAAGLPAKGRRPAYDPAQCDLGTPEADSILMLLDGQITQEQCENELLGLWGLDVDLRTVRAYITQASRQNRVLHSVLRGTNNVRRYAKTI